MCGAPTPTPAHQVDREGPLLGRLEVPGDGGIGWMWVDVLRSSKWSSLHGKSRDFGNI